MIQMQTDLAVADNTGARRVRCIKVTAATFALTRTLRFSSIRTVRLAAPVSLGRWPVSSAIAIT